MTAIKERTLQVEYRSDVFETQYSRTPAIHSSYPPWARQTYGVKTSFTEENVAPGLGPPEMT